MLATILLSTICFGREYRGPQQLVSPERLARKMARQDIRVANVEKLRAQAEESKAALLSAEKELEHKAARLEHLKISMEAYLKHQQAMNDILKEIGLENKQEVQEAIKEVKEAQTDVAKTAEEAGVPVPAEATAPIPVVAEVVPEVAPMAAAEMPVEAIAPAAIETPMAAPVVEEAPVAPVDAAAPTVTAEPAPAVVPAS